MAPCTNGPFRAPISLPLALITPRMKNNIFRPIMLEEKENEKRKCGGENHLDKGLLESPLSGQSKPI